MYKIFGKPGTIFQSASDGFEREDPVRQKLHQFLNYVVLNLSTNCKYLKEIGLQISSMDIKLFLNIEQCNVSKFDKDWDSFMKNQPIGPSYYDLNVIGYSLEIIYHHTAFPSRLKKTLTNYYFQPKTSNRRYIYKYVPNNENLLKLLINNTLWFSDPATFNDPFDCRYIIDAEPSMMCLLQFYHKKSNISNFSAFIKDFIFPTRERYLKDLEQHHFINSFSMQHGICCFSEKYNHRLMWAHYADEYKGVCLIFDQQLQVDDMFYQFSGSKVQYSNNKVKKFFDGSGIFEVTDIFYTKNKQWSYENEVREHRTFEKGEKNRVVSFDPKSLVGIIFGAKMQNETKRSIIDIVSNMHKYNIEFINSSIDLRNSKISLESNRLKLK